MRQQTHLALAEFKQSHLGCTALRSLKFLTQAPKTAATATTIPTAIIIIVTVAARLCVGLSACHNTQRVSVDHGAHVIMSRTRVSGKLLPAPLELTKDGTSSAKL
jgi:hypothetical protein